MELEFAFTPACSSAVLCSKLERVIRPIYRSAYGRAGPRDNAYRTMSPNIATNAMGRNSNQVIADAHAAAHSYSRFSASGKQCRNDPLTRDGLMSMSLFLRAAVRSKLRKIGPKVVHLLLVLNAREDHFCAWNLALWVLDVFLERGLIPNNSRILICV
jgi:hypothetical protein